MSESQVATSGLEGVVVADTQMSSIDGYAGRLVIRGFDVERLAESAGFEDVCALLWDGAKPGSEAAARVRRELGSARVRAHSKIPGLGGALRLPDAMEALRAGLAQLSVRENDHDPRFELLGACAVYAAAWARLRDGREPLAPDPERTHAEDLLRLVRGEEPGERAAALDAYLVTVADHGMNASTFTARIAASTDSDPVSIVTAALCTLKGPLHGGAPGPVLDMLDDIGTPDAAAAWVGTEIEAGRRIMGIGHRVYRVRDPRAAVLEKQIERLERAGVALERLSFARAVEKVAVDALRQRHPDRPLEANVEFYTAVLLDAVGLPRELFTPMFACARTAGWLAHAAEQKQTGRLIRPSCRYVGPEVSAPES